MLKGYLTCEMVAKLVPHYIDDKLPEFQSACVATHLRNCPLCMQKYSTIRKFLSEVKEKHQKMIAEKELGEMVSAHFDGEESKSELLKSEVAICTDERTNEKFEEIATLSKLMAKSYREMQTRLEVDYTDVVMEKYKNRSVFDKMADYIKNKVKF